MNIQNLNPLDIIAQEIIGDNIRITISKFIFKINNCNIGSPKRSKRSLSNGDKPGACPGPPAPGYKPNGFKPGAPGPRALNLK